MPPSRTRETIQSEIDALTAELAGTPPDRVEIRSTRDLVRYSFAKDCSGGLVVTQDDGVRVNSVSRSNADALRDWLNYHFPKETI